MWEHRPLGIVLSRRLGEKRENWGDVNTPELTGNPSRRTALRREQRERFERSHRRKDGATRRK
jgi:hypothetical protein